MPKLRARISVATDCSTATGFLTIDTSWSRAIKSPVLMKIQSHFLRIDMRPLTAISGTMAISL